jgi:hypothetical protein
MFLFERKWDLEGLKKKGEGGDAFLPKVHILPPLHARTDQ